MALTWNRRTRAELGSLALAGYVPVWAALPTPVAPSTAGDWIGLIQGYIKDGGLVLGLAIAALWFGWSQAPRQLTVHIPPNLRSGAVLAVDEIAPANANAYALSTQSLARLVSNASKWSPYYEHQKDVWDVKL